MSIDMVILFPINFRPKYAKDIFRIVRYTNWKYATYFRQSSNILITNTKIYNILVYEYI